MSQFIKGDIVASKSGTQYLVHFVEPDGRMGISPMSGKGSFRNMNAANATMVTPAPRPTRSELREAAIQEALEGAPVAAEPARVLSPMDRDRQIQRIAAEIRGAQSEQRWGAHPLAAALYDAGIRATDPAGFGN